MSDIFENPNLWTGYGGSPPFWWESVSADDRWWYYNNVLATWDASYKSANITLTNGGMTAQSSTASQSLVRGTQSRGAGLWYFEILVGNMATPTSTSYFVGIVDATVPTNNYVGQASASLGWRSNGGTATNGGAQASAGFTSGDVLGIAWDQSDRRVYFYKNGVAVVNRQYGPTITAAYPAISFNSATLQSGTARFDDSEFTYSPPVGYTAWGSASSDTEVSLIGSPVEMDSNVVGEWQITSPMTYPGLTVRILTTSSPLDFPIDGSSVGTGEFTIPSGTVVTGFAVRTNGVDAIAGTGVLALAFSQELPTVPNVIGFNPGEAAQILSNAGYELGAQSEQYNLAPIGQIINQSPSAGTPAALGTLVDVVVSAGPAPVIVPEIRGLTAADANTAIQNAGLRVGEVGFVSDSQYAIGSVVTQAIAAGTRVPAETLLGYAINVFLLPFERNRTVISQYWNSPTIRALVDSLGDAVDPRTDFSAFYQYVWNVDTAQGFGLDIWGSIVGISRLLRIPSDSAYLGFRNTSIPQDWKPFGQAVFFAGRLSTQAYLLPDDTYRTLILAKALANIATTNAPSLNRLLNNLFPSRGRCYVIDNGGMSMTFYFEFELSLAEYAILSESGALPHPAGVRYNVVIAGSSVS